MDIGSGNPEGHFGTCLGHSGITGLLVMQSESDEIVPYECSAKILVAASGPKRHYIMKNALHNFADTVDPDGYYDAINSFLKDFTGWKPT